VPREEEPVTPPVTPDAGISTPEDAAVAVAPPPTSTVKPDCCNPDCSKICKPNITVEGSCSGWWWLLFILILINLAGTGYLVWRRLNDNGRRY
jgi:hypothetical protein